MQENTVSCVAPLWEAGGVLVQVVDASHAAVVVATRLLVASFYDM